MKIKVIIVWAIVLGIPFCFTLRVNAELYELPIALGIAECRTQNYIALDCSKAIEKKILTNGNKTILRNGSTLTIHLENNAITLTDKNTAKVDDDINYTYLGYESKLGLHVIYMLYWEGDGYKVINHKQ